MPMHQSCMHVASLLVAALRALPEDPGDDNPGYPGCYQNIAPCGPFAQKSQYLVNYCVCSCKPILTCDPCSMSVVVAVAGVC
jgi:hypothetical protein